MINEMKCQPGCLSFDGGEKKHRKDCPFYPESLTKAWHDTEAALEARIEALEAQVREQALQILASEGQACDALEAQLKAQAQVAQARAGALREAIQAVDEAGYYCIPPYEETGSLPEQIDHCVNAIEALIDTPAPDPDPVQEAARSKLEPRLSELNSLCADAERRGPSHKGYVTDSTYYGWCGERSGLQQALRAIAEGESNV